MSDINLCRLCLNVCNECKSLYCASGQTNEIYDITVKYFQTIFVNVDQKNQNTVMCLECWHHISDFHSYQQSVFEAQRQLLQKKSFMEYQCLIQSIAFRENVSCSIHIKEEDEDSKTDLEFMEEFSFSNTMETVKNEDDCNIKPAYNPEDSANVDTNHYDLHNPNENDSSIRNVHSPEDSANVGTTHNRLHIAKEDLLSATANTPEDSDNVCTIASGIYNSNEDPSIRTANKNPEDLASVNTIHNGLHKANEENPSVRIEDNPKDSENIRTIKSGLYSIEYELINESDEFSEQSNSAECHSLGDDSLPSNGNQQINTMESKRPKPQSDLNRFVSKWRKNLECGRCGLMLTSFALLECHFRQEHPNEHGHIAKPQTHKLLKRSKNAFMCPKCGLRLTGPASLYEHKRKCVGVYKPRRKPYTKKPYTRTPFEKIDQFIAICKPNLECVICHETRPLFSELQMHFQSDHPNDDFYVMCCQREFIKRSLFKEHVWLHLDPNAFKCNICGKNNSTYRALQVHMLSIHDITLETKSIDDIGAEIQRNLNSSLKDNIIQ